MKKILPIGFTLLLLFSLNLNGFSQADTLYSMTVSPNPFEGQVTININPGDKNLRGIKVFDLIGKEVANVDLIHKVGPAIYILDFSNLKPGIYFCNVYSDKGIIETRKLFRTK